MPIPKLKREDCDDIRRMYRENKDLKISHLARLFRVSEPVVSKVLDGTYRAIEDYDERMATKRKSGKTKSASLYDYEFNVEIMECKNCGRLALSLDQGDGCATRITDHKCSGAWTVLKKLPVRFMKSDLKLAIQAFKEEQDARRGSTSAHQSTEVAG